MINIPNEIYKKVTELRIKKGSVIKTSLKEIAKPHFYILVSHSAKDNPLLFVIATSKIDFYDRHPEFNKDILRIGAKELSVFCKPTIIKCRELKRISREDLLRNFLDKKLHFEEDLPPEYISKIDDIIRRSRLISNEDKELVLGPS
ncbi:MAG: hypothetical protein V2A65_08185 [Candidatus Omnitrophota bacterium]